MLNKELLEYNNKLYWIYRTVRENQIKEGNVNDIKEFWLCDLVLKTKNQDESWFVFLREIKDAEII